MKTVKLIEQLDNRSVGIFQDEKGFFMAMTFTRSSKPLKTLKAAERWLEKNYAG